MRIYAHPSRLLARQVGFDFLIICWTIGWALVGRAVHGSVTAIASPSRAIAERTEQMSDAAGEAAEQLSGWPAIGQPARVPFDRLADQLDQVAQAAHDQVAAIEAAATVSGLVVFGIPVLVMSVRWLTWRVRFVRLHTETNRLASRPGGTELLALRALATQPLRTLLAADADPLTSWRAGDATTIKRLAALELARFGVTSEPAQPED